MPAAPTRSKSDVEVTVNPQVEEAFDILWAKSARYDSLYDYYDGKHPQIFLTEKLRRLFMNIDVSFSENWCGVVVDSRLDKTQLLGISISDDEQAKTWSEDMFTELGVAGEADALHEAIYVCGEGYFIAGYESAIGPLPPEIRGELLPEQILEEYGVTERPPVEAYFNDPRHVHVWYDRAQPKRMEKAAKMWTDSMGHYQMILYYLDEFQWYRSNETVDKVQDGKGFRFTGFFPNPYPRIPVFHFRTSKRRIRSALQNALDPQRAANKALNDLMVAAEFSAFRQKYVISNAEIGAENLESSPLGVWEIPAGDGIGQETRVGEFSETNLANYLKVIDRESNVVAATTGTPKHYLLEITGANVAGETLLTLEGPLNKRVKKTIDWLKPEWAELWHFLLQLGGYENVKKKQISVLYERPESVQPLTRAQIRRENKEAGIPVRTTLRDEEGWTDEKLNVFDKDIEWQRDQDRETLALSLLKVSGGTPAPSS